MGAERRFPKPSSATKSGEVKRGMQRKLRHQPLFARAHGDGLGNGTTGDGVFSRSRPDASSVAQRAGGDAQVLAKGAHKVRG